MGVPAAVKTLYTQAKAEFDKNGSNTASLITKTKVELAKLKNQLVLEGVEKDELQLSRDLYEMSALHAVKNNDVDGFERNVKQLKTHYRDFGSILGASPKETQIMGLYLLYLLSSDRIGEFHTELELITKRDSQEITHAVELEIALMEGNYTKINQTVATLSKQGYYGVFLMNLMETMRRRIVESLEKSSHTVGVNLAMKMMYMSNVGELQAFIKKIQEEAADEMIDEDSKTAYSNWKIVGDQLQFAESMEVPQINPYETIQNAIGYATEIERIV